MVAGIAPALVVAAGGGFGGRGVQGTSCDLGLGKVGTAAHLLDGRAIEVAGRDIERREIAVGTQDIVDRADRFEQLGPIDV